MEKYKVLLIEDDQLTRITFSEQLRSLQCLVIEARSQEEANQKIKSHTFDIAFIDLDLDRPLSGLDIISKLKEKNIYSVVLSGREEDRIIETAYQNGCDDYLVKPYNRKSLDLIFTKYKNQKNKSNFISELKNKFMTEDDDMVAQLKVIEAAVLSDRPILITGETGTGKTFLAKFIHQLMGKEMPFVHLNCAEISEQLLESELFGHEKGAFTGALKNKKGMLELADNGILFLDEVATMPMNLQKKLLKALEEKEFYPLGAERPVRSNFRLISATCENLEEKISKEEFRRDLYFRIEGFNVHLRALRERKNDIEKIIQVFIKKGHRRFVFSKDAKECMINHDWSGNVRELEKIVEILQLKEKGIIEQEDVMAILKRKDAHKKVMYDLDGVKEIGLKNYVEQLEAEIVKDALKKNQSKVRKTLSDLKLSNNAFYRIMENIKNSGINYVG